MPRSSAYGKRQANRLGIVSSVAAVSDGAATVIAEMGQIVMDLTDGKVYYVDSGTLTQ